MSSEFFSQYSHKKVLIFGLGIHGGGTASALFFLKNGAQVRVTDIRTEEVLYESIKKILAVTSKVSFTIGSHSQKDIEWADIIVLNPGVSPEIPLINLAQKFGKEITNEADIFLKFCPCPAIGITGTRGKTTTTSWIHTLLSTTNEHVVLTGNSSETPMLSVLENLQSYSSVVVELSSYQLELVKNSPSTAVITNLSRDHLNRHKTMESYAKSKAHIFTFQKKEEKCILNFENEWTPFFEKIPHEGEKFYFNLSSQDKLRKGLVHEHGKLYFKEKNNILNELWDTKGFIQHWGQHNFENACAASLATYLNGMSWESIFRGWNTLHTVRFRQEKIFDNGTLTIINDTTATSPAGTIAALQRFASTELVLICGGTDKSLDFTEWARVVAHTVLPENIYFLSGSATEKMKESLQNIHFPWARSTESNDPKSLITSAYTKAKKISLRDVAQSSHPTRVTLLFSPGAASFELFKHEFDRGLQFEKIIGHGPSIDGTMTS